MKLKTFFSLILAIAAVFAVAAFIISKRRINLESEDEFDLDDYDDVYEELDEYEPSIVDEDEVEEAEEVAEEVKKKIDENIVTQQIEKTYERSAKSTAKFGDDALANVDDLLEKTAIRETKF